MTVPTVTPARLYAEDLVEGTAYDLGSHVVTQDEIIEFARQWDPLAIHVDEAAARHSTFGGIIASGIHSLGIVQRLAVDCVLSRWALIAGRAIEDLQLTIPVRPGMELHGELRILSVEISSHDRARVSYACALRHDALPALTFRALVYVLRRPQGSPA